MVTAPVAASFGCPAWIASVSKRYMFPLLPHECGGPHAADMSGRKTSGGTRVEEAVSLRVRARAGHQHSARSAKHGAEDKGMRASLSTDGQECLRRVHF